MINMYNHWYQGGDETVDIGNLHNFIFTFINDTFSDVHSTNENMGYIELLHFREKTILDKRSLIAIRPSDNLNDKLTCVRVGCYKNNENIIKKIIVNNPDPSVSIKTYICRLFNINAEPYYIYPGSDKNVLLFGWKNSRPDADRLRLMNYDIDQLLNFCNPNVDNKDMDYKNRKAKIPKTSSEQIFYRSRRDSIMSNLIPLYEGLNIDNETKLTIKYKLYKGTLTSNVPGYIIKFDTTERFDSSTTDKNVVLPFIEFILMDENTIYIDLVGAKTEGKRGWCGAMITILLDIIDNRYISYFNNVSVIKLQNSSITFNGGITNGTICYIKNIGSRFPYFRHEPIYTGYAKNVEQVIYDLSMLLAELNNDNTLWHTLFQKMNYTVLSEKQDKDIIIDARDPNSDTDFYFYKNIPDIYQNIPVINTLKDIQNISPIDEFKLPSMQRFESDRDPVLVAGGAAQILNVILIVCVLLLLFVIYQKKFRYCSRRPYYRHRKQHLYLGTHSAPL